MSNLWIVVPLCVIAGAKAWEVFAPEAVQSCILYKKWRSERAWKKMIEKRNKKK